MFECDFTREILERFPDYKLVDYGFAHRLDRLPQDDGTCFFVIQAARYQLFFIFSFKK